jgi:Na+-transporting NADH:ubiquinone oxidoreductase subunit F
MSVATEPPPTTEPQPDVMDYSLVGPNAALSVEKGLADADWYQSPVPRDTMRELLVRRDGPAIRDTVIWFGLLILFGTLGVIWWGDWYAVFPFAAYGVLYGSTSDSRWHEAGHGTAFKTDWMNNALYEIASFMVMREPTVWRCSHTRHHSDTIVVGRDPEIAVPRPASLANIALAFLGIGGAKLHFKRILVHCTGRLLEEEETYIPKAEYPGIFLRARIHLLIYAGVIGCCFAMGSILPLMLIGLPNLYGAWLMPIYGLTQHAGLAENVLDHRLNCRTVDMNLINRYLYWNMHFHVEHHMFPLVPYHNLPRLHEIVKGDMPTPYPGIVAAFREIVPTVLRQVKDPGYFVKRKLPTPTVPASANVAAKTIVSTSQPDAEGWIEIAADTAIDREDVLRFDHAENTYAVYRTADDRYHATDGICTHGNTHLATGWVKGDLIECPKHNGRFDIRDGSPQRPPVCIALRTYPVRVADGNLFLNIDQAGGEGSQRTETFYDFHVVSNENVATFIKELVLEPTEESAKLSYQPGQYLQFNIPAYGEIGFEGFDVRPPFADIWKVQHVHEFRAESHTAVRRNFSLAGNPERDTTMRFNVRIATPPRGQDCLAGVGSSYVWSLKPGDKVSAVGPFGDFLVKPTEREMVYLGGGSGMAPLRSHLSHLFETQQTTRRVSYWYGARARQELFYVEYLQGLAKQFPGFSFHPALSEPLPGDHWDSHTGLIHDVLKREYLDGHADPASIEYYLCGPQPMIQAARKMLDHLGIPHDQVAFDEF